VAVLKLVDKMFINGLFGFGHILLFEGKLQLRCWIVRWYVKVRRGKEIGGNVLFQGQVVQCVPHLVCGFCHHGCRWRVDENDVIYPAAVGGVV
jgi:hypothetical protein